MAEGWRPAAELEAEARAINAQPWEPMPGMVKRQCLRCRYWFAAPGADAEATSCCPDCAALGQSLRHTHLTLMPQVLSLRHLPGFKERRPDVPPGTVYIGRRNARYGLPASKWANPFRPSSPAEHEAVVAMYERWLRRQPLMDELHELRGLDLVCWCAPLPCHGDVLLRLANETA